MRDVYVKSVALMGTVVTIEVVGQSANAREAAEREQAVERAFGWFHAVEACCTRFDPDSEVMRLVPSVATPVRVSDLLYAAVECALALAIDTAGAFDPAIGHEMESRGFNREYRTGRIVRTDLGSDTGAATSYRDVHLDARQRTITLDRPLILDLGAVAKGLAVDLAAGELRPFADWGIDAGGDLYLAGQSSKGTAWSVGIRHPRDTSQLIETLRVSGAAVCTSGDYEREGPGAGAHHVLDPRTREPATGAASVTVVGPTAMLADALATAAFVLGPRDGVALLERYGVEGLMVSPALERFATRGMRSEFDNGHRGPAVSRGAPVLPDA